MQHADDLRASAAQVDVLDVAGRMIANPARAMVSRAATLALAHSVESLWEVCLEALILVAALERTMPWAEPVDDEHCEHVALQAARVRHLMNALTGTSQKEEDHGNAD